MVAAEDDYAHLSALSDGSNRPSIHPDVEARRIAGKQFSALTQIEIFGLARVQDSRKNRSARRRKRNPSCLGR